VERPTAGSILGKYGFAFKMKRGGRKILPGRTGQDLGRGLAIEFLKREYKLKR